MSDSMSDEAVYRTAPATPGLLITVIDLGPSIGVFRLPSRNSNES